MRGQNIRATTPSGAGPGTNGPATPFRNQPRTPFAPGYSQGANIPVYENTAGIAQAFPGMGFQNRRSRGAGRGRAPVPLNMDVIRAWLAANGNPFMLVPNQNVINGLQQGSSFAPSSVSTPMDQVAHFPNVPRGMYPPLNNMIPGYNSSPYMMNYGLPNMSNNQQFPWGTPNGQNRPQNENNTPIQYFSGPFGPNAGSSPLPEYPSGNMYPQMGPPLPLQMMRTPNGYVAHDMEALTQQEPAIPSAVPAMWTNPSEMSLAKCLENREGITNVYIRGFLPETTDEMLHAYAARFGEIERCKAIVDLDSGLCKGFGFVQFRSYDSCENCIRGFFYLGYQASFAQKSRNSRLKDLEDKSSTNIYCTNLPVDWTEADLRRHFEPYRVVSEKISRDEETGVSKEVGFARFETREIAEKVLAEFHNVTAKHDNVKLLLRFADTKAQKLLKQQSNERRAYRAGEYNYSVEVVQGSTPSPTARRFQRSSAQITPNSQQSFNTPGGMNSIGSDWTPATSISPTYTKPQHTAQPLTALENTRMYQDGFHRRSMTEISSSSQTARPDSPDVEPRSYMSSPRKPSPGKEKFRAGSMSP